jgi:hypothetical protein
MVLGISEDFTSTVEFDSQLSSIPSSGLYLNSGTHPIITVNNLLEFLPNINFNFSEWDSSTSYGVFTETRNKKDIVSYNTVDGFRVFQSIKSGTNNAPTNSEYWLETNIESLRVKTFLEKVKDKVYSELSLEKTLVNNQFLYENGDFQKTLNGDFSGWVIEPKGSDYVSFRINQISFQKDGTTPVNLYVLNQNQLINTISITPDEGRLNFQDVDLKLSGKGDFKLLIDSTDVYTSNATIDPQKFDGFVAYTTTGTGNDVQTADYTYNVHGNGLGLNMTAFLDPKVYIDNNISEFGSFIRATFEYMVFQMFLHNANNRSNRTERIQLEKNMLLRELKDMNVDSVIRRFYNAKRKALNMLEKTFDTQLNKNNSITLHLGAI